VLLWLAVLLIVPSIVLEDLMAAPQHPQEVDVAIIRLPSVKLFDRVPRGELLACLDATLVGVPDELGHRRYHILFSDVLGEFQDLLRGDRVLGRECRKSCDGWGGYISSLFPCLAF
jgi:hypothetical protein